MFALVSTTVTTTTLTHVDNPLPLVATPLPPAPNLAPDHPAAMDPTCRSIPRMTEAVADPMFVARAVCVTELEECVQPLLGSDLVFHERLQRLVEIGIELPATHLQTELLYQPGRRYGIVKGSVRLFQKQSKLLFFLKHDKLIIILSIGLDIGFNLFSTKRVLQLFINLLETLSKSKFKKCTQKKFKNFLSKKIFVCILLFEIRSLSKVIEKI